MYSQDTKLLEYLCYLPATDEIAGLCEHASSEFPSLKMGNNLAVVRSIPRGSMSG